VSPESPKMGVLKVSPKSPGLGPLVLYVWLVLIYKTRMSRLAVDFLDQGLHRVLFDAMPMPVFLVDQDVTILEYNSAAARLLGAEKEAVLHRRGGDVLRCVHSREASRGCGHSPACIDCVVRNSVLDAARKHRVTRRATDLELLTDGKTAKVKVRVSCQPVSYGSQSFFLLVLEGLND
jgi:PAS domain-containing protein